MIRINYGGMFSAKSNYMDFASLFFFYFFVMPRMSENNKIALICIFSGVITGTVLSVILPAEKLAAALVSPNALVAGGLAAWSVNCQNKNECEDEETTN